MHLSLKRLVFKKRRVPSAVANTAPRRSFETWFAAYRERLEQACKGAKR